MYVKRYLVLLSDTNEYPNILELPHETFQSAWEALKAENRFREPVKGLCSCGQWVELVDEYYGACQCPKCGKWYNLFGQELVSPEYWEQDPEETW